MLPIWLPKRQIRHKKGLALSELTPCYHLVPEARFELARAQGPLDFESSTSTSFITPASERDNYSDAWFAVSMLISKAHSA